MRRGGRAGLLRTAVRLLLLALVLAGTWLAGLLWFVAALPAAVADRDTPTDAIVVFTGGSERLGTGLELLGRGRAHKLFVSGVYRGVEVAELLRHAQRTPRAAECCIVLGYTAGNTRGNALETAAWMRGEGYRSLRLVTSSYHMPRSLLELRRALPEAEIIPHPVFTDAVKREEWWRWPGTAHLLATEYSKYVVAFARARLFGNRQGIDS